VFCSRVSCRQRSQDNRSSGVPVRAGTWAATGPAGHVADGEPGGADGRHHVNTGGLEEMAAKRVESGKSRANAAGLKPAVRNPTPRKPPAKRAPVPESISRKGQADAPGVKQRPLRKPATGRVAAKKAAAAQSSGRRRSKARKPEIPDAAPALRGLPIVGIGASAGGLRAFEEFFRRMPADSGMAFVLVSHLDPDHASILHELLRKVTDLPVDQIQDGVRVDRDHVYVGPPGKDVAILNGTLQLMEPGRALGVHLPIDYWFRSLARDQQELAVGIILSGNGSDGTLGIQAIKGESGMVMVQDPETASFAGMPRSAIATGLADFVLPPGEMPARLLSYTRGPHLAAQREEPATGTPMSGMIQKIHVLLRNRTGHDFSHYKSSSIMRRVQRRMSLHQITKLEHYLRYMEERAEEADLLFRELLIGVTSFFRDAEAFDSLAKEALPTLIQSKTEEFPLRIWVPGCSTGEEAFSLAILLDEAMACQGKHCDLQIFATDVDVQAIELARLGRYPAGISADVTPRRLKDYFVKEDTHYRVKKEIREAVVFAPQSVFRDPPFTKLDLLSCRNLLIYLCADLQKRLMPMFHYALRPGGILFLGSSETAGGFGELFAPINRKWKIFRRREGAAPIQAVAALRALGGRTGIKEAPAPGRIGVAEGRAALHGFERLLTEIFAPPSVIVNQGGEVVYIHGRTGLYLEPTPGKPSHNVLAMAREGLRAELAEALHRLGTKGEGTVQRDIEIVTDGGPIPVRLSVTRISTPEELRGLFLISFTQTTTAKATERRKATRSGARNRGPRAASLEKELQCTRENLQSAVEELETANEELQATNEELQSTNEELQSSNEELETSREEMQSLNEELQTVNAELQGKVDDLSQANDDMANLLNATDIATVFLDNDLRVKRFTPQATKIIRLIGSDVGRPIGDIVAQLEDHDLVEDATAVLRTLGPKEAEVRSVDGSWFMMRVLPYRTSENTIDGLVMTFVDISRIKEAETGLRAARAEQDVRVRERSAEVTAGSVVLAREVAEGRRGQEILAARVRLLETVMAASPDLIALKDANLVYRFANASFCGMVGRPAEQVVGRTDEHLFTEGGGERLRREDARVLESGVPSVKEEEIQGRGEKRRLYVARTPVMDEVGSLVGVLFSGRLIPEPRMSPAESAAAQTGRE
jgi:two-component system CheB/CheR fusion protein